ncbi:MAG: phenylacetate--CoA ligase family protein, partial [Armatimonadota bacterium]
HTLQPLPAGAEGELVITTLEKEALPVIRYRTGDLCCMSVEPCACGRTFARISRPSIRTDETLVVRGITIQPRAIAETVATVLSVQAQHQVVVGQEGFDDVEIRIALPPEQAVREERLVALSRTRGEAERELTTMLGLPVRVSIVERASLVGPDGRSRVAVDLRGREQG